MTSPMPACPDCGTVSGEHPETCPGSMACEAVMEIDRTFFLEHPDTNVYWRELLPGDLFMSSLESVFSLDGKPMRVRVRQLAEGVRVRSFPTNMGVVLGSLDAEYILSAMQRSAPLPEKWVKAIYDD